MTFFFNLLSLKNRNFKFWSVARGVFEKRVSRRFRRYADFPQINRKGLTDYTDYTEAIRIEIDTRIKAPI